VLKIPPERQAAKRWWQFKQKRKHKK